MKLCTSAQMREMDKYTINNLNMPSTLLMTNAATHIVHEAEKLISPFGTAAVFCGNGNNGGDGVAAAYMLKERGITVRAFLTGKREKMTDDTSEMERRLSERGGVLEPFDPFSQVIASYVNHCDVIIDAIFGIGLNSNLREGALEAVKMINSSKAKVIAADISSGVEADTGRILGDAVHADVTVTFTMAKPGQFSEPGCLYSGDVRVCDIGIPKEVQDMSGSKVFAVTGDDVTLPKRRPDSHKGNYGRDLIIAGSVGFSGAPVMAAKSASRTGAGLVFLGVPSDIYGITAVKCDEVMPFPLPCLNGKLSREALSEILLKSENANVCLAGPGLGQSEDINEIIFTLIKELRIPLVLDADGINSLSGNIDILDEAECPVILTPHPGEFARLGGDAPCSGRIEAATSFSAKHSCTLVLKGHRTVAAFPDGTAYINTTGGPGLAKGGSGDILAGMITSLLGQGFPIKDAVTYAVYLHGLAGDVCAERLGEYSMTAPDVIETLPQIIKQR